MMRKLRFLLVSLFVILVFSQTEGSGLRSRHQPASQRRVDTFPITPSNRTLCPETAQNRPPNRINTTVVLTTLRNALRNITLTGGIPVDAYLIVLEDDHGTSGSDYDRRLEHISGFSGSNGFAIVTQTTASLWTDGRYFLQGDQELDCNWNLMKMGQPGYPSGEEWLVQELQPFSRVGAYPNYVSIDLWQSYEAGVAVGNITMVEMDADLVDLIWITDRPPRPNNPLIVHTIEFTGRLAVDKLSDVRQKMREEEADVLIITTLEEVAWLFNLRGTDRTNSLFYGYALVMEQSASLYLVDFQRLISPAEVQQHLDVNSAGTCKNSASPNCINVKEYRTIMDDIRNLEQSLQKLWLAPTSSYATYSAAGPRRFVYKSPIALMKSVKNDVERRNFYDCIKRDSAAVVEFAAFMEAEIKAGRNWTEITAAAHLETIRRKYKNFKGVSFETISAVGANAAVIHYRPMPVTEKQITNTEVFLVDSGGQYLDGTTDVTRTFHYGTPTDIVKEAYTRVLMGAIELAQTVWPAGLYGSDLDARTRTVLWQNGWDYNHGTGHGIGYFLSVHEGPGRINMGFLDTWEPLHDGMFLSDEPGYYEDGEYGIRLETLVCVEKANTTHHFDNKQFLTFNPATLVPFEPILINYNMLTLSHKIWLNSYNERCLREIGSYFLTNQPREIQAQEWLVARTQPIPLSPTTSSATALVRQSTAIFNIIQLLCASIFLTIVRYQWYTPFGI